MIIELGHHALVLAFLVALLQGTVPLVGAVRRDLALMELGRSAALVQLLALAGAFAALTHAYVTSDFSVLNVAENSHSMKPMLYKVTGVWGNHEGSMLLWVLVLAAFGLAVALRGHGLPAVLKARVLAIQGLLGAGFLGFILLTSNPFLRLDPVPADGRDLNPLLQDPGLAFHPPMLYLGYVGFSVAFSFSVAALIEGRVDPAWARWVRPWTLAAWSALTAGIALGSWWAYYELGWGGWWYWDPVENASFMPWLAGTALLHSAIVVEKRDALKSWTILLAIIAFGFSLMGTFLVRSGVLTSVHAFAVDPDRGLYILVLLAVTIGGALALFAFRAPAMAQGSLFRPISREGGLVANNLLLATATATVCVGTLYPLFLDAATGEKVSVGPPFFHATFVPVMLPLVLLAGIGPMLAWKRADLEGVFTRLRFAALVAGAVALATWLLQHGHHPGPVIGLALAAWLAASTLIEWTGRVGLFRRRGAVARIIGLPRSAHGMTLAHLGLAVFICGAVGDSFWRREVVVDATPGAVAELAGYRVVLEDIRSGNGPNYEAEVVRLRVERDGEAIGELRPERRFYPVQGMRTTEAAIRSRPLGDLYAAVAEGRTPQHRTLRLWHAPLVPWIWAGALMMVTGGLVSLSDRRLRVGAPRRTPGPVTQPAGGD